MIALCPNPFRDSGLSKTGECRTLLSEAGYETCVCPVFTGSEWQPPEKMTVCSIREVLPQLTHVVVLGGDGTILAVVRELDGAEIPILGVNLGTKGFMTSMEPEELPGIVQALQPGVPVSERMMLEVSLLRSGEPILHDYALNDVVIHGYGECIQPTAWADGKEMFSFSGDGLIVATPTGSTGYSMSAGGPIVEPNAENIIISPICAHMMGSRSFVLGPDNTITVEMEKQHDRRAYLSVDGCSVTDLCGGDKIIVRRSGSYTLMVDLGLRNFYAVAYEKLR